MYVINVYDGITIYTRWGVFCLLSGHGIPLTPTAHFSVLFFGIRSVYAVFMSSLATVSVPLANGHCLEEIYACKLLNFNQL